MKTRKLFTRTGRASLAILTAVCLLSACGPEPGREGADAQQESSALPGMEENAQNEPEEAAQEHSSEEAAEETAIETAEDTAALDLTAVMAAEEAASGAGTGETAGAAGAAASTAAAAQAAGSPTEGSAGSDASADADAGKTAAAEALTAEELEALQEFLNEESSYGFLLSSYESPQDIDLNQVFYSGAGFEQGDLEDREKELLLDRIPQKELRTPVVKVTEDQIGELLEEKAGITYEEAAHPLKDYEDWAHIGRYSAWYALRGDTNRMYAVCSDAWKQNSLLTVHYRLQPENPASEAGSAEAEPAQAQSQESAETSADAASAPADNSGFYVPVYEVQLQKTRSGYHFLSNMLWAQKDLIEAQSYLAELSPIGEVFFTPFAPDTDKNEHADVSFGLVQEKKLLALLSPVEAGNIRSDRVFRGVEAVDFTDYNGDGLTDILTVCNYTLLTEDGRRGEDVREARVYTGQEEAVPALDLEKTASVNQDVETLNITNITAFLTGKSDGKNKPFESWKEAYADHIRALDESEYKGFALINLNDDRTPELVQVGATSAKGATIIVYRNGKMEETWLNRQDFRYLEYENLLYSPSGVENLHYDTIYSIKSGKLSISVQGYYGNRNFARVQLDESGQETYDYYWDGGKVSANGYRDGLRFVFDDARAKQCGESELMTAAQLLEKLK